MDPGGAQGLQLHTHFFAPSRSKGQILSQKMDTKLHTQILVVGGNRMASKSRYQPCVSSLVDGRSPLGAAYPLLSLFLAFA